MEKVPKNTVCILFILIFLFPACAGKMSVEEAKKLAVAISEESFVPPPRRINDILMVLEEPGQIDHPNIEVLEIKANTPILDTSNESILAFFFFERGQAAFSLFRWTQALDDFRKAFSYAKKAGITDDKFQGWLARLETWAGNFNYGIELAQHSLEIKERCDTYSLLSRSYIFAGDLEHAKELVERGTEFCSKFEGEGPKKAVAYMTGHLLYAQGNYAKAENNFRYLSSLRSSIKSPAYSILIRTWLAQCLMKQDRLIEAELEIRKALNESVGLSGNKSFSTAVLLADLAEILQAQGRLQDAEKLLKAAIKIQMGSNISSETVFMAETRMRHGNVLADQRKYFEATKEFEFAKADLHQYQYLYGKGFAQNPSVMLSLLRTDHFEEAMELITSAYKNFRRNFGENHYFTSEILALRGIANFKMGRLEQAFEDFSGAVPILLAADIARKNDYSSKQRFEIILETYIDLLAHIHLSKLEKELKINTLAEAFRIADAIRGYAVQRALGANLARSVAVDPELSDIVRKEQDVLQQISALESVISNTLATPDAQQDPDEIKRLKNKIDTLIKARNTLLNVIKDRFPKYSDFVNPQPATISLAQEHLRSDEALISIYSTKNNTYLWSVPKQGEITFAIANLGEKELAQHVAYLRKALDPQPKTFGDIPEFDIIKAYELYSILLKPIEEGWGNASGLIIVADGPLGQLAFSVLPTSKVNLAEEEQELFHKYRKVPWLIRKVSIVRQPSVSSFVSIRALPTGDPKRKAFVGFGDPLFNREQLAQTEKEKIGPQVTLSSNKESVYVRGIRITQTGSLDNEKIATSHIGMLNRLPDTAEEIRSIAHATGADLEQDVFLGKDASEHRVKTMILSDRRIVAFATHALVPGDLDGLSQPAIALCSPTITGENEDGLLTMAEILKLKFNADWVILSACNTGAADGAGAEAASGLGRAFFYAGTRAILVSMWPVETSSARKLTTGLFLYQEENSKLTRAKALQKSMIELIDGPGLKNNDTGKIVASYAHPLFWAPFIIVGESRGDTH